MKTFAKLTSNPRVESRNIEFQLAVKLDQETYIVLMRVIVDTNWIYLFNFTMNELGLNRII